MCHETCSSLFLGGGEDCAQAEEKHWNSKNPNMALKSGPQKKQRDLTMFLRHFRVNDFEPYLKIFGPRNIGK